MNVLEQLGKNLLVPVIKLESADSATPLAETLLASGLPVAEITFRTAAAGAAIRSISRDVSDVLLGAGTVLTVDQVKEAMDAGAMFIVTPGFNPAVVDYCVEQRIPITPGINNPTGVEAALARGLSVVKFFPAEASGGVKMLKAMSAPYADVRYVPTGGVAAANLAEYLSVPTVLAVGGSWMVPADKIKAGDFEAVGALVREAVSLARSLRP
ncbi:MAG: bifunctional 4-hydroxy-2-oxoglutarate aldolase/2-dehydro-3-deoxy-phosphogluconate aldolase [Spirochaetaceae bacterium]|nr:MAG: bifunctional 4-hydroxy-2-oxoglutarate aldolase/2-dehydro-3-deoxy-phosphogluconate aldolase [Spirochaetaceae bacterium]